MGLVVGQDVRDGAVVVSIGGEVDSSTIDEFQSSLQGALDLTADHPARTLVLGLDGVTYFGSAGLNAVLACYERGASNDVVVRVVATNPEVTRPIQVTKLDTVLRPYRSIDDAFADD